MDGHHLFIANPLSKCIRYVRCPVGLVCEAKIFRFELESNRFFRRIRRTRRICKRCHLEFAEENLALRLHSRMFWWTLSRQARPGFALPGSRVGCPEHYSFRSAPRQSAERTWPRFFIAVRTSSRDSVCFRPFFWSDWRW